MEPIPTTKAIKAIEDRTQLEQMKAKFDVELETLEKNIRLNKYSIDTYGLNARCRMYELLTAIQSIENQLDTLRRRENRVRQESIAERKERHRKYRIEQAEAEKVKVIRQHLELEQTRMKLHARTIKVLENDRYTVGMKVAMKQMLAPEVRKAIYEYASVYARAALETEIMEMNLDKPIPAPNFDTPMEKK